MGYRYYFYELPKSDLNEIRECKTQSDLCEWSKRHGYNLERHDEDGEWIDIIKLGKKLHCFGKDVEWAEHMQSKNESIFGNNDLKDQYNTYEPVVCSKKDFETAINACKQLIIECYKDLLTDTPEDPRIAEYNRKQHIQMKLREWENHVDLSPIDMDLNDDKITTSWLYEYAIFELVRLYKTFDWENNVLILMGW